ncbi:hypothetical protein Pogu_1892 [Pyrobaculum oguniense TE7]|uniref:Uncharacterized protein n=1 Tax=Pyrobaculum oguniense (strain DSM 13380 / JCM 10595 / TE7) TaxID=698757 RepID=H6QAZ6_PYROT|nr:hypothetical protein Pogu_1892 [Pyrobaculum oguniense TE7]
MLSDGFRCPSMVIAGEKGLPATLFANFYVDIPMGAVNVILAFLIFSVVVFTTAAFYALYRRFLVEIPETD